MYKLWNALQEAKNYKWVELSHSLNNDSPYWAGIPEGSVKLAQTCYDWGNPMLDCLIQTFQFPGQFGTHIDFPGHFVKGRELSEQYGVKDLIFPLCVIDITEKVKEDIHYAVTPEDIKAYEAKYGPIPDGAFVALYTGWSSRWPDMDALSGKLPRLVSGSAEIYLRGAERRGKRPRNPGHRRLRPGRPGRGSGLRTVCAG